ncbi:MAG: SPASM domain-containing protein, partial [Acidimicrobiia bacterium]|nr:SPASM domain-containing protein [Acidimicrobiia bacterium]MDX2467716.1 SPASM domain-containing protein [Acidimicrobiia bacterium]
VMAGLDLLKKHEVEFNVLTPVHAANQEHGLEVYRFLRDGAGAQFMQFIPIVERDNETGFQEGTAVTERSVSGSGYGRFMIEVFEEWVRLDVGQVFVQLFDVALAAWVGAPVGLCVFAETCGNALALEHNGDLYSCDHFVEPQHLVGNLADSKLGEMVASPQQRAFGSAKRDTLPDQCRGCEVRFMCNGGCPKNRFTGTADGQPGLNYLCDGYRPFFNHIRPAMDFMAAELNARRPPANVMR